MTDNEDYNPSLNEGHYLHLEATDTSYINATLLETSISDDLSSLINNNAATNPIGTISAPKPKPLPDERKIITPKKRRKKDKETGSNSNTVAAEDSSFTESAKTSTNGVLTGITNSPSPSQAKISDDFTTCSFLINLDGSALPLENDNTDGQNESFGPENLSCSMLSGVDCNDIENISCKIQNFQAIILEKDKRIAEMAEMLEIAVKHKENQDINLLRIAEDSERLEDKFNKISICPNPRVHENEVGVGGENTLDQFELSSYLNPPNAHSLLMCRPEMSPKETQTYQNENISVGVECDLSSLTPSMVQQKCKDLQLSSQILRSEITSLKSYVTNYFQSIGGSNSEELVRVINVVFHKQNADLSALKLEYSKDIDHQNNIQIGLKEELEILKIQCEKTLEAKDEEIHSLKDEIKQLHEKDKEFKLQQENEIQTVQLTNEGIIKNKDDEIKTLTAKNRRLEETLKNYNLDKKKEIDQVKLRNEEDLRNEKEKVRSLRVKVSQMEDAKRNEHKLNSLSSRLSPEGSELEGDLSVADSTSGGESHYRLTRTKIDYLKLTPPVECIDDGEILEQSSSSDIPNSVVEDLKLQLLDMEKKYDANRKYLDEQTIEREQERDEYHRTIDDYRLKNEELKKESERLISSVANQKHEIGDCEMRLKDACETEQELIKKCERFEDELKSAVDKIFELREIIRDLEEQIDSATVNAIDLKDQNQILSEELDRLETLKRDHDDAMNTTQDTINTLGGDMVEELQTQLGDITRRLEKKLNEMDNFPWQTRPNSSCSGAISVSTEDVSVREFSYINRDKDCDPKDAGPLLCDGLRRLDTHFENFVRFQEIIVKKLQDADLRLSFTKKRIEDLENEKLVYQENAKSQINAIADLESRLDQFRFEPSPSAMTLSGLRARVSSLTEECDQYKGNLELRTYELQDAMKRHAATQATLEQYKKVAAQNAASQVSKYSVQTQSQTNMNNSFTQTDKVVNNVPRVPTKEACVQTNELLKNNEKYQYFNRHSFELSTIHGGPAPTFSTPNDVVNLQKSSIKNNNANAWSFLGRGDADSALLGGTPETARNRGQASLLALSGDKSIERLSNKSVSFNMKTLDQERGDIDRPTDSDNFGLGGDESYDFLDDKPEKSSRLSKDRTKTPLTSINGPKAGDSGQSDKIENSKPASKNIDPTESEVSSSENEPQSRRISSGKKKPSVATDNGPQSGQSNDSEEPLPEIESNRSVPTNESSRNFMGGQATPKKMSKKFLRREESRVEEDENSQGRRNSKGQPVENSQERRSSEGRKNSKGQSDDNAYDSQGRRPLESRKNSKDQSDDKANDSQGRKNSSGRRDSKSRPDGYAYDGKLPKKTNEFSEDQSNITIETSAVSDRDSADRYSNFEDDIESDSSMDENRRNSKQRRSLQPDLFDASDDERMQKEMHRRSMPGDEDDISPPGRNRKLSNSEGKEPKMPKDVKYLTEGTKDEQIDKMLNRIGELEHKLGRNVTMLTNVDLGNNQAETILRDGLGEFEKKIQYPVDVVGDDLGVNPLADISYTYGDKGIRFLDADLYIGECPATLENSMYGPNAVQRGRIADTDLQVELEALKTQQNLLQNALDLEKARNRDLEGIMSQLNNQPANSFVDEVQYRSPMYANQPQSPCRSNVTNPQQLELMEAFQQAEQSRRDAEEELEIMRQELEQILREKENEIKILKTQLETAAQQVHHKNSVLNDTRQSDSSTLRQKVSSVNYLELYLKTRSFRKALIWQKKYLLLTIQGYKDILRASGIHYDPDLLQKEVVIAPSSVGLADRRKPLTRFKIVAKAMVALARMKYMVNRWDSKSPKLLSTDDSPAVPSSRIASVGPSSRIATAGPSSRVASTGPSSRVVSRTESRRAITTPPTRDARGANSSTTASITNIPLQRDTQTNRRSSVNPRFPNATVNPIEFSTAPSTSSVPARPTASGTTQLSQYLDRFNYLENELGHSLGRETRRPPDHEHDE